MGVGGGASVLSAQFYGKGDYNNVKKTVAIMLRVILSVAVVCMVISLFFPEELLRIYTADTAVIEKGAIYLRYSTASFVMMAITMTLTLILRSIHDVKIPLYASIGSFFVNIFLTGSLFLVTLVCHRCRLPVPQSEPFLPVCLS